MPAPPKSARGAQSEPGSDSARAPVVAALAGALLVALAVAWLLHRSLFEAHAQTFDAMTYGRALWGVAHGSGENSVAGVHWLAVHANLILFALAPFTAWAGSVAILLAAQVVALAATIALVVSRAARGHAHPALVALFLAFVLSWGTPLVLNPFLFDVRPDLVGVPLCVAGLLRIQRSRCVDAVAVAWLFAALLVREDFSMVIAPALVFLPLDAGRGLTRRVRWSLAGAAIAYTLVYYAVARQWIAGAADVARVNEMRSSFAALPTWASLWTKPEILFASSAAVGGLALLGWRWSVPAWPGLIYLLANNRLPEYTLNAHYALFAAPGLCVAAVAGSQRLRTFSHSRRRLAWIGVLVLSSIAGFISSAAPGGGRFLVQYFDLAPGPGKASVLDHTPGYRESRQLLERIPPAAGLVVPLSVGAACVDRPLVWEGNRLRRALGGAETIPAGIRWVALARNEWHDTGKTLVQRQGFRLFDESSDWLAVLTRDDVEGGGALNATTKAEVTGRVLARWPDAGLRVSSIWRRGGQFAAVLVRERVPAPLVAGRPLCLLLDGLASPVELTALDGLLDPRDIPVGRAAEFTAPAGPGPLRVFARLAAQDGEGRFVVLEAEGVERVDVP